MIKAATDDITKGWPYDAERSWPRNLIADAISDNNWQGYRKSLKGLDTVDKLKHLQTWYIESLKRPSVYRWKCRVQVENYLGALRRGGQLDANNMIQKVR